MELVIDIGNTRTKAGLFINNGIHKVLVVDDPMDELFASLEDFSPKSVIISSVKKEVSLVSSYWKEKAQVLVLDEYTSLPVKNKYGTPATLGKDRLAAVIGARFLHSDGPVLAIDAGTCITYDVLTADNEYLGGNISPGATMRFKSLNAFTDALPLVKEYNPEALFGNDTTSSISTGVINGLACEIDGVIGEYEAAFPGLKTVICGGEARYFVNHIKKKIFANQNLVLLGLHKILKFNE